MSVVWASISQLFGQYIYHTCIGTIYSQLFCQSGSLILNDHSGWIIMLFVLTGLVAACPCETHMHSDQAKSKWATFFGVSWTSKHKLPFPGASTMQILVNTYSFQHENTMHCMAPHLIWLQHHASHTEVQDAIAWDGNWTQNKMTKTADWDSDLIGHDNDESSWIRPLLRNTFCWNIS